MKVWIDQDLCTGDGICEEITPDVFVMVGEFAHIKDVGGEPLPEGAQGLGTIPDGKLEDAIESALACPGDCIYIEPPDGF